MGARSRPRCVIVGGGGHAAVIVDAMLAAGKDRPVVILDADPRRWGRTLIEVPIKGGDELLSQLFKKGITRFVVGLGGVGDNGPRRRLFERAEGLGFKPVSVVHPAAVLSRRAFVGAGSVLLAGAIVNANTRIGRNVIVNTGAIVEHDCVVEDHVHLATGARIAGGVSIGAGAHVGAGAVVRQGITVGPDAVVAAGAVVVKNVARGETVMGVPASRTVRTRAGC